MLRSRNQGGPTNTCTVCHLKPANRSFHVLELGGEILIKIKVIYGEFTAIGTSASYVFVSRPDEGGTENMWYSPWHAASDV